MNDLQHLLAGLSASCLGGLCIGWGWKFDSSALGIIGIVVGAIGMKFCMKAWRLFV